MTIDRRHFIKQAAKCGAIIACRPESFKANPQDSLSQFEARYYKQLPEKVIQCQLCPWQCVVKPDKRGRCQARKNINGRYYSLIYGRITAIHSDPIEKKPFYHFLPDTMAFSLATSSCNLDCKFCQNWTLARRRPDEIRNTAFQPNEMINYARDRGASTLAYTYNEPTIYNEFITDTTRLARKENLRTVIISNGFINQPPLKELTELVDAYKVDLKSFSKDYYTNVVHGHLQPVLDTLVSLRQANIWTEIVYLTVPTLNDNLSEAKKMVQWITRELGPDVPVHFTRFVPKYKLKNLPPTPVRTLENLRDTALQGGVRFAYVGNVPGHDGENTYCPDCQKRLITRIGFKILENNIEAGRCSTCKTAIPGVWE